MDFSLRCLLFILIALGLQATVLNAQEMEDLEYSIYYIKPNEELKLEEVQELEMNKLENGVLNLGVHQNSIWLKIITYSESNIPDYILKFRNSVYREVQFFRKDKVTNEFVSETISKSKPFKFRKYNSRSFLFDLQVSKNQYDTSYVRIKSILPLVIPIDILTSEEQLIQNNNRLVVSSIYLGVIFIMLAYNLLMAISMKSKTFSFYVFYILFIGLTQLSMNGFGFKYFWPSNTFLEGVSINLFGSLSGVTAILFTNRFLKVRTYTPLINQIFLVSIVIFILSALLALLNFPQLSFVIMQANTAFVSILGLVASIRITRKKYEPAKFYLAAWSFLILGVLIFLLKDYNILPYNFYTENAVIIGSTFQIALLSLGLSNRINVFRKQRDIAQDLIMDALKEKEKLIQEQNIHLEHQVNVRTEELQKSNTELEKTLTDLKNAQAQLVESEKMSSLGQLTAGIAHEINNPINFVNANVGPLKRDIDALLHMLQETELIASSDIKLEDKINNIKQLKDEFELDYLIEEIDHLLNGIKDGADRTSVIIGGLRTFSRIDNLEKSYNDVNEGIRSTLIIIRSMMPQQIVLETEYGELNKLYCNLGKLNQVFLNMLTNAVYAIKMKFGEGAGGILKITTEEKYPFVLINIEDNGIGMNEETKNKIFDPFFTTKKVGDGTGLGMSISSTIINQHDGKVNIQSEEGKGTKIIIELPII